MLQSFAAVCFSSCVRNHRKDEALKKGCHVEPVNITFHVKLCNVFYVIAFC